MFFFVVLLLIKILFTKIDVVFYVDLFFFFFFCFVLSAMLLLLLSFCSLFGFVGVNVEEVGRELLREIIDERDEVPDDDEFNTFIVLALIGLDTLFDVLVLLLPVLIEAALATATRVFICVALPGRERIVVLASGITCSNGIDINELERRLCIDDDDDARLDDVIVGWILPELGRRLLTLVNAPLDVDVDDNGVDVRLSL